MSLWQFIILPQNSIFFYSIAIFLLIALMEIISLVAGVSLSSLLDDLIPDFGVDADLDIDLDIDVGVDADLDVDVGVDADVDVDVDADIDVDADGVAPHIAILGWLNFGRVPFMILVVINLLSYGFSGYTLQKIIMKITHSPMNKLLISLLALIPAFLLVHYIGRFLAKVMPQVESNAITLDTLVGSVGEIVIGTASVNNPAEVKVKDKFEKIHYVRVLPINDDLKITQGEKVLLVEFKENIFYVDKFDI